MSDKGGAQVLAKFIHGSYIPYKHSLKLFLNFVKFGAEEMAY